MERIYSLIWDTQWVYKFVEYFNNSAEAFGVLYHIICMYLIFVAFLIVFWIFYILLKYGFKKVSSIDNLIITYSLSIKKYFEKDLFESYKSNAKLKYSIYYSDLYNIFLGNNKSEYLHIFDVTELTVLETLWSSIPMSFVGLVSYPSVAVEYLVSPDVNPSVIVKVVGNQWYWDVEVTTSVTPVYSEVIYDYKDSALPITKELSSNMCSLEFVENSECTTCTDEIPSDYWDDHFIKLAEEYFLEYKRLLLEDPNNIKYAKIISKCPDYVEKIKSMSFSDLKLVKLGDIFDDFTNELKLLEDGKSSKELVNQKFLEFFNIENYKNNDNFDFKSAFNNYHDYITNVSNEEIRAVNRYEYILATNEFFDFVNGLAHYHKFDFSLNLLRIASERYIDILNSLYHKDYPELFPSEDPSVLRANFELKNRVDYIRLLDHIVYKLNEVMDDNRINAKITVDVLNDLELPEHVWDSLNVKYAIEVWKRSEEEIERFRTFLSEELDINEVLRKPLHLSEVTEVYSNTPDFGAIYSLLSKNASFNELKAALKLNFDYGRIKTYLGEKLDLYEFKQLSTNEDRKVIPDLPKQVVNLIMLLDDIEDKFLCHALYEEIRLADIYMEEQREIKALEESLLLEKELEEQENIEKALQVQKFQDELKQKNAFLNSPAYISFLKHIDDVNNDAFINELKNMEYVNLSKNYSLNLLSNNVDFYRLLSIDTKIVLPVNVPIKFIVTSTDVIHSLALPAGGMKMDAVPGRTSEQIVSFSRPGIFYGQCSELCGPYHGFMPFVIEVVSYDTFFYHMIRE